MDLTSQALAFDTQRVGVHIGLMWTDYMKLCGPLDANWSSYATIGNGVSFTVGRLSFTYGLTGPCVGIDTACSSSLVAMQLGLDHMSTRECQNALAGGANAILVPDGTLHLSQLGALSSSGRCKTLSAFADGYGRGEGFATVLVGPHDDARTTTYAQYFPFPSTTTAEQAA